MDQTKGRRQEEAPMEEQEEKEIQYLTWPYTNMSKIRYNLT